MRSRFVVALAAGLLLPAAVAHSKPKYSVAEGVPCAYCHVNPAGGGARNYRGSFYGMNSHSFAGFDDAAEAKKAGAEVGPNAELKPKSLSAAPSATAGGVSIVPVITDPKGWVLQPKQTTATAVVEGDALKLTLPAGMEQNRQLAHPFAVPPAADAQFMVHFEAKSDTLCTLRVSAQRASAAEKDYKGIGLARAVEVGTEYKAFDLPWTVTAPHPTRNKIAFVLTRLTTGDAVPVTLFLRGVTVLPVGGGVAAVAAVIPPPPKPAKPPIPDIDPHTLPDFARWQDPVSGIWFVKIPAGVYRRGTTDEQRADLQKRGLWSPLNTDEMPARTVRITKPFLIGEKEVTQAEWRDAFATEIAAAAAAAKGQKKVKKSAVSSDSPSAFKGPDRPVDSVSFQDAQAFCRSLSAASDGKAVYRLPTEAEWEYAARAGSDGVLPLGADHQLVTPETLKQYSWMNGTASNATGKAGGKTANAWGLYDMLGNVWEWCRDAYSPTAYASLPDADPVSTNASATERVLRGGCWFLDARSQRPSLRGGNLPTYKSQYVGLRLVREL